MKQRKTISVDLYGMTGYGPTKTEAKQDAERHLESAMHGSYTPRMYRFPAGYMGVITREPVGGWQYTILGPQDTARHGAGCLGIETADQAERGLRRHIAQNLIFVTDDNGLKVLTHEADRRSHQEYIVWQEYYKELLAQGYSDTDAHRLACEGRGMCSPAA